MALPRPMQCIGVISAVPGEGKSTIAVNLANVLARGGRSTLLIDADLRNPELSRRLGADAKCGLLELMAGSVPLSQATRIVSDSKLVLSSRGAAAADRELGRPARLRAHAHRAVGGAPRVRSRDRRSATAWPISDARAISPLIDAFILVVNWGRHPLRCP